MLHKTGAASIKKRFPNEKRVISKKLKRYAKEIPEIFIKIFVGIGSPQKEHE